MAALGVAQIVIGVALVCVGVIFWLRAARRPNALGDAEGSEQAKMSNVRPRLDQIRNSSQSGSAEEK